MPTTTTLTDTERRMLAFSRLTWAFEGRREQAIRDEFGMSREIFSQKLVHLIQTEAAIAFDPIVCRRLRGQIDRRRRVARGQRAS